MRYIEIDKGSGFCFGVVNAIKKVEETLEKGDALYCLGDIVHNGQEVNRLESKGLETINHEQYYTIKNSRVLLRAHGEPPRIYDHARGAGIEIIDATCPVVLQLQKKIRLKYESIKGKDIQIVLYGKPGHAEIVGLLGQTDDTAIVIESVHEIDKIDFSKGICLFSQTTKSIDGFNHLVNLIQSRLPGDLLFEHHDTICRQVSNRIPNIKDFATQFDLVLFVSGKKSSNGKVLYEECRKVNLNSHMISDQTEVTFEMIRPANRIGICGATSTPRWLMEEVEKQIRQIEKLHEE